MQKQPLMFSSYVYARWLDVLPGGMAWATCIGVVIGAIFAPSKLLIGVTLLALYLAGRFVLAGTAALWGLRQISQWQTIDWQSEYLRRATRDCLRLDQVHHLILIPNYQENVEILRRTLKNLAGQKNAAQQISVVLAMEMAEAGALAKAALLRAEFAGCFAHVLITVHPAGLAGETRCKSANLSWAIRQARSKLVDDPAQVIVTVMDADTLWHPAYFESLAVLFATDPRRYSTYWQAPIRYHANVWGAYPLLRILHASASAWELAYLVVPWWRKLPMSSYSLSLCLLDRAEYWDVDAIADEWHMAIKSYFVLGGQQWVQPVFLPFLVNMIPGRTAWAALRERYQQSFRHAWGAKEIGYTLALMVLNRRVVSWGVFGLLGRVAHDNLMAGAGWIVIFLGSQLPLLFHPNWMHVYWSVPGILFQAALLVAGLLTLMFWLLDFRIRP
ncbi:MAG: glycosyltransferase, partial [Chloroflexi bacterium]|nr:glycosyltransferase [Chloroflexota bacterium]